MVNAQRQVARNNPPPGRVHGAGEWGTHLEQVTRGAGMPPAGPRQDGAASARRGAIERRERGPACLSRIEGCIPALRRYAASLLRNRDEADDLVHDCLVRALDKLHTRRDEADVRAWLFTIMHNRLHQPDAPPALPPDRPRSLDESHEASHSQPASQEDGLQWRDLLRGLARLPEEQRSVVLLVSVEDLSYAEAAQVLRVPIGTVMSRLARGRERLRQLTDQDRRPTLRRVK